MLILAVALIVIGPEQMPAVVRAAAKVIRELRAATNEVMRELGEALDEDEAARPPARLPRPERRPPAGPPDQSQP